MIPCCQKKEELGDPLFLSTGNNSLIPRKISLHGWKVQHRRLATFENLLKCVIISNLKDCPFCKLYSETGSHIFFDCFIAKGLIIEIVKWWNISLPGNMLESIFLWGEANNINGDKLHIFKATILTYFWQIWKTRNEFVHDKNHDLIERIFTLIQGLTFFWINSKKKLNHSSVF